VAFLLKGFPMEKEVYDFELALRLLGNEIIAIRLSASTIKNKWLLVGFLGFFSFLTGIAVFGEDIRLLLSMI
jgi:hypothetical protein